MNRVCSQCGVTFDSTFAAALAASFGAGLSWDPNKCRKGKKALKMRHEWVDAAPTIEAKRTVP